MMRTRQSTRRRCCSRISRARPRLLADLGEVTYAEVLATHHRLIRTAMLDHGGQEVGTEGDSFFVIFGRASDAISASVDAQRALGRASWPAGIRVRVRMGLHTGPIARAGGNLVGMAIHTAARIKSAAHGGQIVVSAATARDAELDDDVTLTSLGSHRFRDINGRVELFEVGHPELVAATFHRSHQSHRTSPRYPGPWQDLWDGFENGRRSNGCSRSIAS